MDTHHLDANGVFRVVTVPGPSLLMGNCYLPGVAFKYAIPDPDYPQLFKMQSGLYMFRGAGIVQGNFCKVLQIKPDAAVVKQDIVLERQKVLGVVKIQDAEGRPLPEAIAWGGSARGGSCTIYGEAADPPRLVVFYEAKRKLAGTLPVKTGEKLPPVVKLKPMGSVTGRLLDAGGKPLAGIVVDPHYRDGTADYVMHSQLHEGRPITSNANGVFTLDSLIPELKLELTFRHGKQRFERESKPADPAIQVKSGECRDLGAIKLK